MLLPGREALCTFVTRMDRRLVDDHDGLWHDRVTQRLTTGNPHAWVYGFFQQRGRHIIVAMHTPQPSDPPLLPGRQLDDALWLLPGIGHRGITRKARCIKGIESKLAVVCLWLHGFKGTLPCGTCCRISESLYRLSHTFPSKACLVGQTFQRRNTAALLGWVGSALPPLVERTGGFFARVLRAFLVVWGELGGSAPARVIMHTLGARAFQWLDPGRHGDAMDLRGLCNGLDGHACGTPQQPMGAAPSSECGII